MNHTIANCSFKPSSYLSSVADGSTLLWYLLAWTCSSVFSTVVAPMRKEGAVPCTCLGPNWSSAQAPALEAITERTRAPCAAGRKVSVLHRSPARALLFHVCHLWQQQGTHFQTVGSGNVSGYMKYSFPLLLSGNIRIYKYIFLWKLRLVQKGD